MPLICRHSTDCTLPALQYQQLDPSPAAKGCDANGAACCPGVATPVPNPKPCKDPAAYCQQSLFDNDYSYFLQYQANPKNVTPAAYGTCTVWPIDKCGQAGVWYRPGVAEGHAGASCSTTGLPVSVLTAPQRTGM